MIYLGVYLYPQADDFAFSGNTHNTWIATHSFFEVIKVAASTSLHYWNTWAGTFSSVFLFSLQPEAFFNRGYAIVPFLFIAILSGSIWIFVNTIMRKVLKFDMCSAKTIASFVLIYVVWYLPDPCEGIYWYNGASHYITSFSMMLITVSLILIANHSKHNVRYAFLASITSIMVGGGNFISALLLAVLFVLFFIYYVYTKQKKMIVWLVPAVIFYVSFFINVIAPGNANRQSFMGLEPANPIEAIISSFGYSMEYCFSEWSSFFLVMMTVMLVPFIWKGLGNCEFRFKYPLLVVGVSFCLISSMFAPAAYAAQSDGPGRVQNIIFSFYIICLVLNEVYILGWLKDNVQVMAIKYKVRYFMIICVLLLAFFGLIEYRHDDKYCNILTALSILKNGQAVEYAALVEENLEILNSDESVVKIHKIVDGPSFFYSREIDDWKSGTKVYFNKELIEYYETDN